MRATPGSLLTITGHHVGEPDRTGEVLESRGPDGTPPFLVRWDDTGHVTLLFPGSDCVVRELRHHDTPEHDTPEHDTPEHDTPEHDTPEHDTRERTARHDQEDTP